MDSKEIARAEPGSVSWGTMRPEDLIPKFLDTLRYLDDEKWREITAEYIALGWPADEDHELIVDDPLPDELFELSGWLLEELFDALTERGPDGHYFGSHPGDGADYGFWPFDDD